MKKLTQLTLLLAVILGFSSQAQSAVLLEPVLGYNLGTKLNIEDGEKYSGGMGPSFGGRVGYQNLGFQLGLDYLNSTIDMKDDDFDKDVKMTEWAAFAGFEFPVLVRVYAGYIFSANAKSGSTKLNDGSGAKFGVGFTGLPFVDINLEYRRGTFTEIKAGGVTADVDTKYETIMLGVSLPFTI